MVQRRLPEHLQLFTRMRRLQNACTRFLSRLRHQAGQGLVEYALVLSLIALLVVVALKFLQPAITTDLNNVANGM